MQIKNIEKKIKATKEKTEVLGGRISPTKMVAFNLIAKALDITPAELFKATIDECIEEFFKSMLKININKAKKLVDERLDKTMKKASRVRDYRTLSPAEQKIALIMNYDNFPKEIPLFWFFDDIRLEFDRNTEAIEKERWIAYKNYLDEIEEKESSDLSVRLAEMQEQNAELEQHLKQEEIDNGIIQEYYDCINAGKEVSEEVKAKFNALDPIYVKEEELLQYPFVKDSNGNQKYTDEEILKAVNDVMSSTISVGSKNKKITFTSIQDIHDYMQKTIQKRTEEEKELIEKLDVVGAQSGEYGKKDLNNIEEDPFGITDGFMSKQKFPDEMIVKYWKHYMSDIEYFKDRDFTVENIKAYTILKNDGILN